MEVIIVLSLVVLIILLLDFRSSMKNEINKINYRLDRFDESIQGIRQGTQKVSAEKPVDEPKPKIVPERIITPEPKREPVVSSVSEYKKEIRPQFHESITVPPVPEPTKPKPSFFERNPDLEKFIGENLANKIGIAILVLGIGFFVKYAIDKEWIGIYGRVAIGVLCGGALIGIAHRLRKSFIAFSSVMVGGGIAVLYLTIYIAFQSYKIMDQPTAFAIMVVITAFNLMLSLGYNRMELAILAILGGFGSPFMVSTGEGNYVVLFSYILILDIGLLILAFFKKWRPVNVIAYAFTIVLFASWLAKSFVQNDPAMIRGGLLFATLFYLVFFVTNIINNIRKRVPFEALEFMILLSNTFLYYSAGMYLLQNSYAEMFQGLFTTAVGVFNFAFAYILYRRQDVDRNLVFLLIGLVLTFISLAAPVQLEGNYITLFWAAEAVLLLWLSQKSGIALIKLASVIVMALMFISLAMDWFNVYVLTVNDTLRVILNKGYVTGLVALVSVALCLKLFRRETTQFREQAVVARMILAASAVTILYFSNLLELRHQVDFFVDDIPARTVVIGLYNVLFVLLLMLAEPKLPMPDSIRRAFPVAGVVAIFSYFALYHRQIILARDNYLDGAASAAGLLIHYPYIIGLLVVAALCLMKIRSWKNFNMETYNAYSWFFVFFFLFIASAELDHTVVLTLGADSTTLGHIILQNHKIGYPILWGVASFVLIAVGLQQKLRHLRIIALTLFLVTLLKLFLIDIRGISEGGKIAAFISLGLLLLIMSFMYQRLKKLLL